MALRRVEQLGRSVVCTRSQNGRNVGGQLSKDIKRIFGRAWIVNARECSSSPPQGDVTVAYQKGLPTVTLPLPSRQERCRFTLRPFTSTVGEFIENIKQEDKDRVRIAASTKIQSLLQEDFHLVVNDVIYHVLAAPTESSPSVDASGLSEVKTQVARLYESLQIDIHQLEQERKILCQLEELKQKLEPLERKKEELAVASHKRTVMLSWLGLGWMGVQFGILARLTWWEYSWDIMEPVTFFITYGTTIVMYAYFVLTRQEYYLSDVHDRQYLITFYKKARKEGLDVETYNSLRKAVAETEENLRRLRDPLQLHLPFKELKQEIKSPETNFSGENVAR
ncbi:calcium uniporter protein, mitochondrial-like isoform X2 [Limulus polyphemus]|uniref:Calcium uniporter protein n=1 Tax=Limulus polyphemus TaxID=6850 RepID=A0ABM1S902_LIMPO|nr:calcium uniporter protein, mitochondrial-like isoform X2 [Limulus polyphemus]